MVKLIASDIDGTLIPYGEQTLSEGLFPIIRRLRAAGVWFCPASGRQFHSIRTLFAPVAEDICCLCENGAILYGTGTEESAPVLAKTAMPRKEALALAHAILEMPGYPILISGERTAYVCGGTAEYLRYLRQEKGNLVAEISAPEEIEEDIIKVSVYCPQGTAEPMELLGARWGESLHMAAAGPDWVDFGLADKGIGLRGLCAGLGVALEDTVAFGDNWNDVAMLDTAGRSYLMSTADPALLERYPRHCDSVLTELEKILKDLGA